MANFNLKTFNPEAFGRYIDTLPKDRLNALLTSGVLRPNSQIRQAFTGQTGVVYASLPMYGLIGGEAQNYDGETDMEAETTTTYKRSVIVVGRMKAWMEKDFAEDVTGGAGFMSNVGRQVNRYWEDIDQDTLIAILTGMFNMTGALNLPFVTNHTYDTTEIDDGVVGATTLNNAIQQASGDHKRNFTMAVMHSVVATQLENKGLLERYTPANAEGLQRDLGMATWNGRRVIIDDNMPTADGDGGTVYTTYVLGQGAFDYENIGAEVPYAMSRDEYKNGGLETLHSRQRKVFAPYGVSFTQANMTTNSPAKAELATGANWELVKDAGGTQTINHKHIPIARILSLG